MHRYLPIFDASVFSYTASSKVGIRRRHRGYGVGTFGSACRQNGAFLPSCRTGGGAHVRRPGVYNWWLAAARYLRPERVVRVPADEVLNFLQTVWEWLCISPACVVDEAETSKPECPDLGPLLSVISLGNFEGAPHPTKITPAFWALGRNIFRSLP